jgi:hypothetical protein
MKRLSLTILATAAVAAGVAPLASAKSPAALNAYAKSHASLSPQGTKIVPLRHARHVVF